MGVRIENTPVVAAALIFAALFIIIGTLISMVYGELSTALEKAGIYGVGALANSAVVAIVSVALVAMAAIIVFTAYNTIREEE